MRVGSRTDARQQALSQAAQAQRHHPVAHRVSLAVGTAVHQKFVYWFQVLAGAVEAPARFGCDTSFHFNGHQALAGRIDDQVNLGAVAAAVETELCVPWCGIEQGFNRKAFPTVAHHRVRQQGVVRTQPQQGVQQAAVAHVDLGGLDQALAQRGTDLRTTGSFNAIFGRNIGFV